MKFVLRAYQLTDAAAFVGADELSRRSRDELDGQIGRNADGQQTGRHATRLVFTRATLIFIQYLCVAVRTCVHTSRGGRCVHTCVRMCVFKQAYLFTFALENPLIFECRRQNTSPCSVSH